MTPPKDPSQRESTVTFVIPCFNHGRFIADAVRSCLAQELTEARVVIVDDGSDDGMTAQACDACKDLPGWVEVIHQKNRGLSAARNAGARQASIHESEFLVFLDADDYLEPTFVRKLRAAIDSAAMSDPASRGIGSGAVSHAYCQERLTDKAFGVWAVPAWDPVLLLITNLHPVTALIRRECFEAATVGAEHEGFDETMRKGYEDWDLWIRFSILGWRGVRVREPLFNWRRHAEVTMVMESVKHHEELVRALMKKHRQAYERHAAEIMVRSNVLLRRAEANWLDENHEAIYVRDLRARNIELFGELEQAKKEGEESKALAQREAARVAEIYEAKLAQKIARRIGKVVGLFPRPIADWIRRIARGESAPE